MKRKIFDGKLYLDSLRRTAIIGGLFTVLLTVASLLIFFAYMMNTRYVSPENITIMALNFYEINPVLVAVPYLFTPLLCLNLFGFLNKRSTSDFWHSVPFTRPCLYNTFSLAVLTWSFAAVIVSGAVSLACFSTLTTFYAVNWTSVLTTVLSIFSAQLLIMAGVNISMSITGSYFSNVIVAILVLFFPRVLMLFFAYASTNSHLFVVSMEGSLLAPDHNIVAGLILSLDNVPEILSSFGSIIYTAVLGIIYYFVGLVLFTLRKSESAGQSAVNKYMQAAFRIIVCLTVCLIPIYLITEELNRNQQYFSADDWFSVFVLYVIAAVAYFVYELITTKKLKNLAKAIPALGVVALLNILLIGGAHIAYRVEYDYTPTPDTVTEVHLGDPDNNNYEYFETAVSQLVISDNSLEQILCDAYAETRRAYEFGNMYQHTNQSIVVGFKTNGVYHYRHVGLTDEQYLKLNDLLYEDSTFREIFDIEQVFDKAFGENLYFHLPIEYDESFGVRLEDMSDEIKKAYIEDVKALDFSAWYTIATSNAYDEVSLYNEKTGKSEYGYVVAAFEGSISLGSSNPYFSLPISNFTPKAYNLIMELAMDNQQSHYAQQKLIETLKSDDYGFDNADGKYYHDISIELYNGTRKGQAEYYTIDNYEKLSKLIETLEPIVGDVPDADSRIGVVYYHYQSKEESKYEDYESHNVLFRIPDDADLTFLMGEGLNDTSIPTDLEIDE